MIFEFLKFSFTISFLFIFTYKSSEKQTKVSVIKSEFKAEFRTCIALLVMSLIWMERSSTLIWKLHKNINFNRDIQIFASILQCMHCIGICGREEAFVKCTSANIDEWVTLLFCKEDWVIEFINIHIRLNKSIFLIMLPKYPA